MHICALTVTCTVHLIGTGCYRFGLAIVSEKPMAIIETSIEADNFFYEAWERSNRLSLNLMRMTMVENVKPTMPKTDNAKAFMLKIKEYSQSNIANKSHCRDLNE